MDKKINVAARRDDALDRRSGDRDGGSKLRHLNLSSSSFAGNIRWFGVGAGILAIFAILTLFCDYFSHLGIGGAEPDPYAHARAGIIVIASGLFWVISAWPQA